MKTKLTKGLALSLLLLSGCSATPVPMWQLNHFSTAAEDEAHSKCMAEHALFNNRQLLVSPAAVQDAWAYCAEQSELWFPDPEAAEEFLSNPWGDE